jgi:hypothetical protein
VLIECDSEASIMGRPWPTRGVAPLGEKRCNIIDKLPLNKTRISIDSM